MAALTKSQLEHRSIADEVRGRFCSRFWDSASCTLCCAFVLPTLAYESVRMELWIGPFVLGAVV